MAHVRRQSGANSTAFTAPLSDSAPPHTERKSRSVKWQDGQRAKGRPPLLKSPSGHRFARPAAATARPPSRRCCSARCRRADAPDLSSRFPYEVSSQEREIFRYLFRDSFDGHTDFTECSVQLFAWGCALVNGATIWANWVLKEEVDDMRDQAERFLLGLLLWFEFVAWNLLLVRSILQFGLARVGAPAAAPPGGDDAQSPASDADLSLGDREHRTRIRRARVVASSVDLLGHANVFALLQFYTPQALLTRLRNFKDTARHPGGILRVAISAFVLVCGFAVCIGGIFARVNHVCFVRTGGAGEWGVREFAAWVGFLNNLSRLDVSNLTSRRLLENVCVGHFAPHAGVQQAEAAELLEDFYVQCLHTGDMGLDHQGLGELTAFFIRLNSHSLARYLEMRDGIGPAALMARERLDLPTEERALSVGLSSGEQAPPTDDQDEPLSADQLTLRSMDPYVVPPVPPRAVTHPLQRLMRCQCSSASLGAADRDSIAQGFPLDALDGARPPSPFALGGQPAGPAPGVTAAVPPPAGAAAAPAEPVQGQLVLRPGVPPCSVDVAAEVALTVVVCFAKAVPAGPGGCCQSLNRDTYVELTVAHCPAVVGRTSVRSGSQHPIFDEAFVFPPPPPEAWNRERAVRVHLRLRDHDRKGGAARLGSGAVVFRDAELTDAAGGPEACMHLVRMCPDPGEEGGAPDAESPERSPERGPEVGVAVILRPPQHIAALRSAFRAAAAAGATLAAAIGCDSAQSGGLTSSEGSSPAGAAPRRRTRAVPDGAAVANVPFGGQQDSPPPCPGGVAAPRGPTPERGSTPWEARSSEAVSGVTASSRSSSVEHIAVQLPSPLPGDAGAMEQGREGDGSWTNDQGSGSPQRSGTPTRGGSGSPGEEGEEETSASEETDSQVAAAQAPQWVDDDWSPEPTLGTRGWGGSDEASPTP
eukprot:TRINITY_DN3094_c0_g1_i1.p1 TRINITY_DN3094_c0_g1~~TRINITY_DN3094_c0_g1_i1.p1  ORF type:complete len:931 (+),score=232.57 TRINITY_DN3094_c0_g1_i1:125-2917(+)